MARIKGTSHLRGWKIVAEDIDPSHGKYYESVFTLGNGYMGVRGSYEEAVTGPFSEPLTLIAEVYDDPGADDKPERLAPAPNWLFVSFDDGAGPFTMDSGETLSESRTLNLRRGTLERHVRRRSADGRITSIVSTRIVSQARPHIAAVAYSVIPENYSGRVKLTSLIDGNATYADGVVQTREVSRASEGNVVHYIARTTQSCVEIAGAARHTLECAGRPVDAETRVLSPDKTIGLEYDFEVEEGKVYTLEKVLAMHSSKRDHAPAAAAITSVARAPGFAALEREHAAVWKGYWKDCAIRIVGDPFAQTMARFWVFQLLQAASKSTVDLGLSASIPAKTLSGPGYNGHIFWDTEIYMLPFFSQQYPDIAKSLLMYRYDRLDAARRNAAAEGRQGARFPWESAGSGEETTPKWCPTGWMEVHVIADISFAVWQHYLTTGDEDFLLGPGLELILETARYWSTRAEKKRGGGSYHYEIDGVIGPDEFHDDVNNSVFTNAMARWNINKAIELLDRLKSERPDAHKRMTESLSITARELVKWRDVADRIKINFDPETGLYEEFDGYFALDEQDRRIKQADVLLMLYLLPELRTTEIFRKNFEVYYPVTAHESSLSPAVHVLFALDIGYRDHAYDYEIMACSVDGVRRGGATDAGLHAASLGGGWSSIVAGFGGVRVMPDHLRVAPDLPDKWKLLEFSIMYRGLRLRFKIEPGLLIIDADDKGRPVDLEVAGTRAVIRPGETIQAAW